MKGLGLTDVNQMEKHHRTFHRGANGR
uniref:Uncharacterized protein n=1 Tax=Anguilla anguilla TaxID=7936 RepID=A0A0E9TB88_ANGAN